MAGGGRRRRLLRRAAFCHPPCAMALPPHTIGHPTPAIARTPGTLHLSRPLGDLSPGASVHFLPEFGHSPCRIGHPPAPGFQKWDTFAPLRPVNGLREPEAAPRHPASTRSDRPNVPLQDTAGHSPQADAKLYRADAELYTVSAQLEDTRKRMRGKICRKPPGNSCRDATARLRRASGRVQQGVSLADTLRTSARS